MDEKRYDWVLKHEEQNRKINAAKFMEKKKLEKLEEYKIAASQPPQSDVKKFKLNSKGKAVFSDKKKNG